ncbi:DNA mismatch repair protein MutS [bacterium]|nr:DNA mismatch repair protein MutS [bacterium]
MARHRSLNPEEEQLWREVARTIRPTAEAALARLRKPVPLVDPGPPDVVAPAKAAPFAAFRLGEKARPLRSAAYIAPSPAEALAQAPLQMDARKHAKMTRGKLDPEARIDLHGLTLAEAHPELIRFILNAQTAGLRLVLVITGKGKQRPDHGPIPYRMGVLRHQVPQWLHMAPLGPAVLQVSEAHLKHGGGGAYYVYLRRRQA